MVDGWRQVSKKIVPGAKLIATDARCYSVMQLNVALNEAERDEGRSLLASSGGYVDGAQGRNTPSSYERICQRQSDPDGCLRLITGGFTFGPMERRMMALYFAIDTVWDGVEEAIKDHANPTALRALVTTLIGRALVTLVAPEPIMKFVAIALTASLIAGRNPAASTHHEGPRSLKHGKALL
ncbi:hypothetical protein [Myxococcus sp. RHSTA-1-4]|uniref:hypothetical protein n=1 Tax=Myxococcus sp. RHSTA-1-4 TaxID=2874601 RepID=UPI001CBF5839|nr:hypothetical protein [Myxococcus sp. RHSTA-1-4]